MYTVKYDNAKLFIKTIVEDNTVTWVAIFVFPSSCIVCFKKCLLLVIEHFIC